MNDTKPDLTTCAMAALALPEASPMERITFAWLILAEHGGESSPGPYSERHLSEGLGIGQHRLRPALTGLRKRDLISRVYTVDQSTGRSTAHFGVRDGLVDL